MRLCSASWAFAGSQSVHVGEAEGHKRTQVVLPGAPTEEAITAMARCEVGVSTLQHTFTVIFTQEKICQHLKPLSNKTLKNNSTQS